MVFSGMGSSRTLEVEVQGDADDLTATLANAREGLTRFRAAVALAGGALAALGAGSLAAATKAAADFEEQMVEVEKVTDPEIAAEMADAVRDMAAEMPIAQKELAGIVSQAGRLGISGVDNLRTFTRVTAEMATATDIGAREAAEAFARMTTLMELSADDARSLGAAVNELSNNMGASASEIVDAATRSAGVLTQLGLESESILALNAAMNEVSASSRIAGTQLRRFAQALTDPKKAAELADALGMSVDQFKQMRDTEPVALFEQLVRAFEDGGATAEELNSILGTTSRQTLSKLAQNWDAVVEGTNLATEQFENATSLTEEFEAASSTFNARLQVTENRLRNAAIETGSSLLPALTALLGKVNDGIAAFNELNRATDGAAGTLAATGAIAVGVGVALGSLGLVAGGPVTLAIAAIGALAVAYKENWGDIRSITTRGANTVVEQLARINDALFEGQISLGDHGQMLQKWASFIHTRVVNILDELATRLEQLLVLFVASVETLRVAQQEGGQEAMAVMRKRLREFQRMGERLDTRQANRMATAGTILGGDATDEEVIAAAPGIGARLGGGGGTTTPTVDTEATADEMADAYWSAIEENRPTTTGDTTAGIDLSVSDPEGEFLRNRDRNAFDDISSDGTTTGLTGIGTGGMVVVMDGKRVAEVVRENEKRHFSGI